jgi:uncharacterized cupredoxin-like copper-binding protein
MRRFASCRGALLGLALAVPAILLGHAMAAGAPQTVNVVLGDTGPDQMTIKVDSTKVAPGAVTFDVRNLSKEQIHEMIVIKSDGAGKPLPYDNGDQKVVEGRVQDLGEVSDLEPGKSGSLTLDLAPGKYILICNQPGHYMHGMRANLVVPD